MVKRKNAGKKLDFPISKEKLEEIFDSYKFTINGKTTAWMGHIAGNDTKHGEIADVVEIDRKENLLIFKCKNEETASKCLRYLGVESLFKK